jgi:EAL domain-containing protein (putative c-di-GMP-specific phosphodiesterase class I)
VDRTFIDGVDLDPVKSAIVSAVLTMSNAIGMLTVVEGVETIGQLEHLSSLGCEVAQGFYFARPMPASEFAGRFFTAELSQATAEQVG